VDPLTVLVVVALLVGWIGLFALWWFGFRGRGPD
jgi:cbb3-type cytochrome oxidase maturation protein